MTATTKTPDVIVVALDGLVLDTLPLRAHALQSSLGLEGIHIALPHLMQAMPGRALGEVVDALAPDSDPVAREVVALRAQQAISRAMAMGLAVRPDVDVWLSSMLTRGVRVVARADALRNDVDRVLPLLACGSALLFVRCADDRPRVRGARMLESAYQSLVERVTHRWPDAIIGAYEITDEAARIAGGFVHHAMHTDTLHA